MFIRLDTPFADVAQIFAADSPPRRAAHFDGALALIKLRGEEMYATETSKQLLLAVQTQMVSFYRFSHIRYSD